MHDVCDFRARERCIFVHVGVTARDRCNACEWLKQCANVATKSAPEQTLAMGVSGARECSFLQLAWTAARLNS
jgi:predicted RecB family nuclease